MDARRSGFGWGCGGVIHDGVNRRIEDRIAPAGKEFQVTTSGTEASVGNEFTDYFRQVPDIHVGGTPNVKFVAGDANGDVVALAIAAVKFIQE